MDNQTYINRLKKYLYHPRARKYQRIVGIACIIVGMFGGGVEIWKELQSEKINEYIKTQFLPALSSKGDISSEDLSAFHSLIVAENHMGSSHSLHILGGMVIGSGLVLLLGGILSKPNEIIVSLWERIEILENKLGDQDSLKTANNKAIDAHD